MGLELRKDFIIMHIVFMTNVFSSVGVNSWNFFSLWSIYRSRLMNYEAVLAICRGR